MPDQEMDQWTEIIRKKEDLCDELKNCVYDTDSFRVLKHPLYISAPYCEQMNAMINLQFQHRKKMLEEAKSEENWEKYVFLHERPFRFFAFRDIHHKMADKDYWECLGWMWKDSENLFEIEFLDELLRSNRPGQENMMQEEEQKMLAQFPDKVAIYRGYFYTNRKCGHSWSLAYNCAAWFARRFQKKGKIARGEIKKEHIKAFLPSRNEAEIVVLPEHVKNITIPREPKWNVEIARIKKMAIEAYVLKGGRSFHGPDHWFKVGMNGRYLYQRLPNRSACHDLVVELFALLHDCQRNNENEDPEHGHRAAEFIKKNQNRKWFCILSPEQLEKLIYACAWHNDGKTSDDTTIGVCWDADRLDLIRVGIMPDPKYLSTEIAKQSILQI